MPLFPPSQHQLDRCIGHFDRALRAVAGGISGAARRSPAQSVCESGMSDQARRRSIRLMRVNHAGEVAAQALYHGQAATASGESLRGKLEQAAAEEGDHLVWCRERLAELGGRTSHLDPLWYGGSFAIGILAGVAGARWNLGFLAETERQVVEHLEEHLQALPPEDARSRAILEQMKADEQDHMVMAVGSGGSSLPVPLRRLMRLTSKLMTRGAYWI